MRRSLRSLALGFCAMGMLLGAAHANLVTNPGFETGDFTGWTTTNADGQASTGDGVSNAAPNTGTYAASFSNPASLPATISQAISTAIGTSYTVSYYLQNEDIGGTGFTNFTATFGGVVLRTITTGDPFGYTQFSSTPVLATSTSSLLSFRFVNEPSFFDFDDVSVEIAAVTPPPAGTVPEPASIALLGLAGALGVVQTRRRARVA